MDVVITICLIVLFLFQLPLVFLLVNWYKSWKPFKAAKRRIAFVKGLEDRHRYMMGFCNVLFRMKVMNQDQQFRILMNELTKQQFEFEMYTSGSKNPRS